MKTISLEAPTSKSLSHRALIAAALAPGKSVITDVLDARDSLATISCLGAAGAGFDERPGKVTVQGLENGPMGGPLDKSAPPAELFVSESGTTCRLITGVAAAGKGRFRVSGEGRMHARPIGRLTTALEKLGTAFEWEEKEGYPPFVLATKGLQGGVTEIDLEESSQYLSALLLAAPLAESEVRIDVVGSKAVSWPYAALTLKVMEDFKAGFTVQALENGTWTDKPWRALKSIEPGKVRFLVRPTGYQPCDYRVEADWSASSYLLAAGALGPTPVRVANARADSLQGDRTIMDILSSMGAIVQAAPDGVTAHPADNGLTGVDVDMGRCPDLVPTVSVVAALARGETRIRNVGHLRIKESDRLAAVAQELSRIGTEVETFDDGLRIVPAPLPKGKISFSSHGDHRMAMCLTLLALRGIEPELDDADCVAKSFPGFFRVMKPVLAAAKKRGAS